MRRELERTFLAFFGGQLSDRDAFEQLMKRVGKRYDFIAYVFFLKDPDRFMPILVAAHIKPRSECTHAEMNDYRNVVAMCRFGCDEMFERGYAYIADGKVRLNESRMFGSTPAVRV